MVVVDVKGLFEKSKILALLILNTNHLGGVLVQPPITILDFLTLSS